MLPAAKGITVAPATARPSLPRRSDALAGAARVASVVLNHLDRRRGIPGDHRQDLKRWRQPLKSRGHQRGDVSASDDCVGARLPHHL